MLPAVVALVGRPNVGKSTLFNQLTRSRDALVADEPGVTRDRRYGVAERAGRRFLVVDTGGLGVSGSRSSRPHRAADATTRSRKPSALVLVVDHREGLTAEDREIAERLRRLGEARDDRRQQVGGHRGRMSRAQNSSRSAFERSQDCRAARPGHRRPARAGFAGARAASRFRPVYRIGGRSRRRARIGSSRRRDRPTERRQIDADQSADR